MKNMMKWFMDEEDGQGMVEYALIVGIIALACLVITGAVGKTLTALYELMERAIPTVE